ncbi:MAG TPA: hypothetical protein PLQ69_10090 [Paludibacter sp.]|nr:hypothetical protein [Paludibacter sp.]
MAKKELSGRDNWQTESGPGGKAGIAEHRMSTTRPSAMLITSGAWGSSLSMSTACRKSINCVTPLPFSQRDPRHPQGFKHILFLRCTSALVQWKKAYQIQ